jgi:hypothetical protein
MLEQRSLPSTVVVVGLLVVVRLEWLRLVIGIQDHAGKSTSVAIVAPPSGSEHRVVAVGTLARWRLAFKGGFEARSRTVKRRWQKHDQNHPTNAMICYVR